MKPAQLRSYRFDYKQVEIESARYDRVQRDIGANYLSADASLKGEPASMRAAPFVLLVVEVLLTGDNREGASAKVTAQRCDN